MINLDKALDFIHPSLSQHETDHMCHGGGIAISQCFYSLSTIVNPFGAPSVHSKSRDGIRVPITSGSCCPLGFFNRSWDRSPGDLQSRQAGAGKNVHSSAKIRRTKVISTKFKSSTVEANAGKMVIDFGFPRRSSGGLLHDIPLNARLLARLEHFREESSACSVTMDGGADAGSLAGRPTKTDVCTGGVDGFNIFMDRYSRKSRRQHTPAPWI